MLQATDFKQLMSARTRLMGILRLREVIHSYTMLTINADQHPFMRQFHKPDDEKRSVVILNEQDYDDWLQAPVSASRDFLRLYPADNLVAEQPQQSLL